ELQSAGLSKGFLDLVYARHFQPTGTTADVAYDDGWFGYGKVQPPAPPRRTTAALKPSKNLPVLTSSVKDTAPETASQAAASDTASKTASHSDPDSDANTDPDRPVMVRRHPGTQPGTDNQPASQTPSSATTPASADDPDRPVMKHRTSKPPKDSADDSTENSTEDSTKGTAGTPTSTTATQPGSPPSSPHPTTSDTTADSDRPTLKRRTPEEARKAHNANQQSSTTGVESLNEDPNRPNLHRGKPTSALTESDLPRLIGIPQDLHQMVAVSDAVNRDPHPFALAWQDPAQHATVLKKLQSLAQAQLAVYKTTSPASQQKAPPATGRKSAAATRPRRAAKPLATPQTALSDEDLKAYTLSYGGAPTYIYSAHTAGTGSALRYVTIVAQDNGLGELKPAIQNVTDAAHLDRTPRMRFVDVVDAEASNRASLLFELRSQNERQFALYRLIAAHADQIFLTGTTQ
ncbi:MAG: MSCRAMM family adhesin SdrC, partial [Acidobacteriota bacterium]|nr:MSCRAMM family adhesin SdrC [Acidobacteriota bacterium]